LTLADSSLIGGGDANTIRVRDVTLQAGTDASLKGGVFASGTLVVKGGDTASLEGHIVANQIDVNAGQRSGAGGVIGSINTDIKTFGASDGISLKAGSVSGNIELLDSAVQSGGTVTLNADAGHIQHAGGVIRAAELDATAASGIQANTAIGKLTATVTGRGDIEIANSSDLNVSKAGDRRRDLIVENFGNLTAQTVRTLGGAADNDIVLYDAPARVEQLTDFH
jgi:hypothetical protein